MNTELFHEIPDALAILIKGGVSRQVPLFHRGERVYAKANGGFVRLSKQGTSVPGLNLDGIECDEIRTTDGVGWYVYEPGRSKLKAA